MQSEFLKNLPPPPPLPVTPPASPTAELRESPPAELGIKNSEFGIREAELPPPLPVTPPAPAAVVESGIENSEFGIRDASPPQEAVLPVQSGEDVAGRERAVKTIAALEQWLDAIHVTRTQPGA